MNDYKFWIAIYGALVGTTSIIWRFYEFYYDKSERLKVSHKFYTNYIIENGMFTTMFEFSIVNIGTKKVTIESICYQLNLKDQQIYSPLERLISDKIPIEFGDKIIYEVRYNDLNSNIDKTNATKLRLVIGDTTGRIYRSKWIKIIRVPLSYGNLAEMHLNNQANVSLHHLEK